MPASVERNERNHWLYREVNERIREVTKSWGGDGAVEFLCECGRDDCIATVKLTHVRYEALLKGGDCVLLVADHLDQLNGHRVLAENGRFVIVAAD